MGAYIPAGRYPLPSTLLMTVIPAQVAGVQNICVACRIRALRFSRHAQFLRNGADVSDGGAQAIAALAFGTATVPKVDRIVGPGNIYVAAAKKLLAGEVGIDFVAGPTEIVIIADDGDPAHIAADMLAQAEHDVDASAILLTTSRALAERVAHGSRAANSKRLPTAPVACEAIRNNSADRAVSAPWTKPWRFRIASRRSILRFHDACTAARRFDTRAACLSDRTVRKPRAITLRARITCCPRRARPAFAAGCRRRIS